MTREITTVLKQLYSLVAELEEKYPGRKFTLDGHLVGSLGEVIASERYGITLATPSTQGFDGWEKDGTPVEIKATQRESIGLRSTPVRLLVLKIQPDGTFEEVYWGPGKAAWDAAGPIQKNGQRCVRLSRLREIANSASST